jgi:AraC family transcriptional regulator, melibiose operon regulatory protein
MKEFDRSRPDFASYGFAIELWRPVKASRPDRHAEIEINYLASGTLTYLFGSQRLEVRSGQLTLFWAAIPHQVIAFEKVDRYYVATIPLRLAIDWQLPTRLLTPLLHGHFLRDQPSIDNAEARRLGQWCHDFESGDDLSREAMCLELRGRLLRFASTLPSEWTKKDGARSASDRFDCDTHSLRSPSSSGLMANSCFASPAQVTTVGPAIGSAKMTNSHKKAEAMTRFIAQKFLQKIMIADVAKEVGLHEDYAAALFRKTFGMTMVELITSYRVTHSQRLLITTSMPISEVAKASGFETLSRFNCAFKQISGTTPRSFRREMGQDLNGDTSSAPPPAGIAIENLLGGN